MDVNEIKWGCRDDLPEWYDISLFAACTALSYSTHPTIKRKSCPFSNVWLISLVLFDTCLTLSTHPQLFSGRVWQLIYNLSQWSAERNEQKHSFIILWRQMNYFLSSSYKLDWINIKKIHFTLSVGTLTLGVFTLMFNWIIVRIRGGEKTLPVNINTCQSATLFHTHLFTC